MPVKISYRDDGGVVLDAEGIVTGEELIEWNNAIYETDEKTAKLKYQFCDFTKVENFEISNNELHRIAGQDQKAATLNSHMLIAIVGADDLIFGLGRMWEAFVGDVPFETKVFRDVEEAESWLKAQLRKRSS